MRRLLRRFKTAPPTLSPLEQMKAKIAKSRTISIGNRGTVFLGRWAYYGNNTRFTSFHQKEVLAIGNFASIADTSHFLLSSGHHYTEFAANFPVDIYFHTNRIMKQPNYTWMGSDVWIGANTVILPGIRIGNGAVIAAGSVVTKDVLPFSIVGGNPAKLIRHRFGDTNVPQQLHQILWWEWSDAEIAERREFFEQPIEQAITLAQTNDWQRASGIPESYLNDIQLFLGIERKIAEEELRLRDFLYHDDHAYLLHHYNSMSYENLILWKLFLETQRPDCIMELTTGDGSVVKLLSKLSQYLGLTTRFVTIDSQNNAIEHTDQVQYIIENFQDKPSDWYQTWQPTIILHHRVDSLKNALQSNCPWQIVTNVGHRFANNRHQLAQLFPALAPIDHLHYEDERFKAHLFDATQDYGENGMIILQDKYAH